MDRVLVSKLFYLQRKKHLNSMWQHAVMTNPKNCEYTAENPPASRRKKRLKQKKSFKIFEFPFERKND